MPRKCDYLKGVTAGLKARTLFPSYSSFAGPHYQGNYSANQWMRNAERKYVDSLPESDPSVPIRERGRNLRGSRYLEGIRSAFDYGKATQFVVVRYNGTGYYDTTSLAELTVYIDPAEASERAWELDPNGYLFAHRDILYVRGASELLLKQETPELKDN